MIYRYTIDNILSLMQNMGTLKREQIKRFFSSELEPNRVEYLLNQLAIKHILIYDEDADIRIGKAAELRAGNDVAVIYGLGLS